MWRQDYSFVLVILVTCWIPTVTGRQALRPNERCVLL